MVSGTVDVKRFFDLQKANRWAVAQTTAAQRVAKLTRLCDEIEKQSGAIQNAIFEDFRKNPAETDLTEIFPVVSEIKHMIRHLPRWMKPERVGTPLALFGTRSELRHEPKGQVLLLSPWNYPFHLTISPLAAAIAAGNCVIVKPSSKTPKTSHLIYELLSKVFREEEVAVLEGSSAVSDALLELPFDHIFFTGSPPVGRKVMAAASKHLASVTLELGGKSPVIVDDSADIEVAAERIMWAKFINAGQTCVAPDYVLMHESKVDEFAAIARHIIAKRFGATMTSQLENTDLCRLVNESHAKELKALVDKTVAHGAAIAFGGQTDASSRFFSPTVLTSVRNDSPIMQNEIFGPVLPIVSFRDLGDAIRIIQDRAKPLALYIFSENAANVEKIISSTSAGGTCVNTLILHLANPNLPFGGVGNSGMGNYHGYFGFVTLSHQRAVLRQGWFDILKFFYPPYTASVRALLRTAMRWLS